jgi:hypothetical protein
MTFFPFNARMIVGGDFIEGADWLNNCCFAVMFGSLADHFSCFHKSRGYSKEDEKKFRGGQKWKRKIKKD